MNSMLTPLQRLLYLNLQEHPSENQLTFLLQGCIMKENAFAELREKHAEILWLF